MASFQEIAQLLISSWALDQEDLLIPVSDGVFDRALKTIADEGLLPGWASEALHFSNSRVGMRCVETPDILEWAQLALLTSVPNPTYQFTEVQVDARTASRLIQWLDVPEDQARRIGSRMREVVKKELTQSRMQIAV
jgi:hypothetical protein